MSGTMGAKAWTRNATVPVLVLAAAAAFVYWPALRGDWLWDDELDVTGNLLLRDLPGLGRIWFHPAGLYDYYPIKYSVQWLQWQLWQTDTLGYHLTNVTLHALSAGLGWRVLSRLGVKDAWIGAMLFLVHPLAVESVAWITELKNTLSLPFLLLGFLRYLDFDETRRRADYAAALGCFLAALLCKTSVVMFPCILLVHAWWQRRRISGRDLKAIAPFFLLSVALGSLTLWFQHHRAIGSMALNFDPIGGWWARVACAGSSLAFYAWKTVLPIDLMSIYPQWPINPPGVHRLLPWLGLASLTVWCWRNRATWGRHALFGLSWFVLHLVPVLGFVPISSQRFTWVMDHLAYVALLGATGLVAAAIGALRQRQNPQVGAGIFAGTVAIVMALAVAARGQAAVYRDEETLWTHTVRKNPDAWMALYNLGNIAGQKGRSAEAVEWYQQALRTRPNYPEAWNNLGNERRSQGKTAEAIVAYTEAVRLNPRHFAAHNNLGAALADDGRVNEAIARCMEALRLNPHFAPAERNLGHILARSHRNDEAIGHLQRALSLQPNFAEAANDLGVALANAGRREEAVGSYHRALQLKPNYVEAHTNLGTTLRELGKRPAAIAHFKRAIALRPTYPDAHYNLGGALLDEGATTESRAEFAETLRFNPNHPEAHFNLGNLLATAGDSAGALEHFRHATAANPAFAEAYHNAGIVLTRAGRTAEAVEQYRRALQLKPDYVDALLNLAVAYQTLGQMDQAIASYEAARRLRPELPALSR